MQLDRLQDFCMQLRIKLEPIFNTLHYDQLAQTCANVLDINASSSKEYFLEWVKRQYPEYDNRTSAFWIANMVIRRQAEKIAQTGDISPMHDFSCEMVLLPTKGKILMLLYTQQYLYREAIESFPEVKNYPYWDNTDQPDDMTMKQWFRRGDEWNRALKAHPSQIPAMSGFRVDLVPPGFFPEPEEIIKAMPSLERRTYFTARRLVLEDYIKKHKEITVNPCEKASAFIKTPEGDAQFAAERQRLASVLKPVYEEEDLIRFLGGEDEHNLS
jgi:hypothetical protein